MTVWLYEIGEGEYQEAAVVENGEVVSGDEQLVAGPFPDGVPESEEVVARAFTGPATVASTDFEMEWEDTPEWVEESRELGEGNDYLRDAPEWDQPLLEMHAKVVDPNSDPSRTLVSYAESATPEFVLERIREAIRDGAIFSEFDTISSDRLMELRQEMAEGLTEDFTLDSLTENLMEFEDSLSRSEAENIARTESSAILNSAREEGYKDQGVEDERFYWTGASLGDPRQTDACAWLIRQTNPFEGGEPVPLEELREMVDEAPTHDDDMDDNLARPESWVVHPQERSTFALAPSEGI